MKSFLIDFWELLKEVVISTVSIQVVATIGIYLLMSIIILCGNILEANWNWIDISIVYWTAWRIHLVIAIVIHIIGWIYTFCDIYTDIRL